MKRTLEENRAGQLATEMLRWKMARRGVDLKPDDFENRLKRLEKETGYGADFIHGFFIRWILPSVLVACAKRVQVPEYPKVLAVLSLVNLDKVECRLAIKLLALEHIEIIGLGKFLENTLKQLGGAEGEWEMLFLEYILPAQITNEFGWGDNRHPIAECIASGFEALRKTELVPET